MNLSSTTTGDIGGTITLSNAVNTIKTSAASGSQDTITLPVTTSTTDTFAVLGTAQTFSAAQTFTGGAQIGSAGTSLSNLALVAQTLVALVVVPTQLLPLVRVRTVRPA